MKPRHACGAVAALCAVLFALVPAMCAQEASVPTHTGVPQDWSQRHIVFSRDALLQHPELLYREPRILHQARLRWQASNAGVFNGVGPLSTPAANQGHRDWSVNLGGRLVANTFPAKFSFDPDAPPDCTNDYVVFGLSVAGVTGGKPNLVAFNNLYAGAGGLCGGAPTVRFAYNTTTIATGKIVTSPILSLDGKKIAFVESVAGASPSATFHVLTWTAGQGTLAAAAAPTMLSVPFSPAADTTTSSPWIDYASDTVYLGADDGHVYKITGVFKGTPTLAGSPWPVLIGKNLHPTSPVLDSGIGNLMVGASNGTLYSINITTGALGAVIVGKSGGTTPGIAAPPIVDTTNGTTFVVSANDGTSAVLVEVDTSSLLLLARARIGLGSAIPLGGMTGTPVNLYEPAVDNNYFSDPSTGRIRLCGTGAADVTPWQYSFGFTGRTMKTTAAFSQQLLTSTAARCTGWTEFFNPHIAGGTDYFFFGLTQDCTAPGNGFLDGCVAETTGDIAPITFTVSGGPSGIVIDNDSIAGQASSIYFSAEKINTVYKLTQNGLN